MTTDDEAELLSYFSPEYSRLVAVALEMGPWAFGVLLEAFGGEKVHIPTRGEFYRRLAREVRNEQIRAAFRGNNHAELALLHDLSEAQIRRILGEPSGNSAFRTTGAPQPAMRGTQ